MSKRLSRKPSETLARSGYTTRQIRANLLRVWDSATDQNLLDGLVWYDEAHSFAVDLARATDTDLVVVASVIAALSPQTRWETNKSAAVELLKNGTRYPGMLISNYERAKRVINAGPMEALAALQANGDESAPKIASFARNILGDSDRVTVDVWAVRAALVSAKRPVANLDNVLKRVGMYDAIVAQYKWLANHVGVTAPQAQAVVWVALTGKAANADDSPEW
jgi:hypothetical protein